MSSGSNVRTKMVYDNNELIYKDMNMLIDTDYDDSKDNDEVTVTIVQPSDTNYSIEVYLIRYTSSSEDDIYEAETSEAYTETFTATKGNTYFVILIDNTTESLSTDYHLLNTASRGKLTRDITIKFNGD